MHSSLAIARKQSQKGLDTLISEFGAYRISGLSIVTACLQEVLCGEGNEIRIIDSSDDAAAQQEVASTCSIANRGAERKGRNPAQGSREFCNPLGASEFEPPVSAIRGLGNPFPGAH